MKTYPLLCTLGLAIATMAAGTAQARDLTIVNFGGANGDAQKAAFIKPMEKETGKKIIAVAYNGEQAKVKAMVETKNVVWDAVEVETGDLGRGCQEGLYEKLDWSKIGNKANYIPEAVRECGVGTFVWSTVLAYNAKTLKTAPTSWADFWNVKKFPGKRGMRKGAHYNLEFALMADGVAPKDVYKVLATPAGVDRAFKKLDQLKPNIQWWEAGAQPPQMLAAGDVVMSTAYNGRIDAAQREGQPLKNVWNGSIYDLDYWVIPMGSPNKAEAEKFIKFATSTGPQVAYAQHIAYGPVNKAAISKLSPKILAELPNSPANAKSALFSDNTFWTDHGEELDQRFTAWAAR
ncbi:MAG: ABC transporter substrate-binding protein [Candidimonas sp.]|nr:MAG: ABC transporter substrate-binding protein [Candidimonas sp.]TAM23523.1 MAG: ABC transporter substrate-binding protein [Candidimonas sp.]TAM73938.1 MAG: ABC transporter substrate-binding protein [Candidimonas sp.]